ncbi:myogenesis-regulating glycosidase-like [Branchiostoma lanceolatum]|uniref:myogenesis-regulating glycosidase-like n=1 Tax=Branchiostoma lanceolatum TaxID=7740 RepID=UPI0034573974
MEGSKEVLLDGPSPQPDHQKNTRFQVQAVDDNKGQQCLSVPRWTPNIPPSPTGARERTESDASQNPFVDVEEGPNEVKFSDNVKEDAQPLDGPKEPQELRLKVCVFFLAVLIIAGVITIWYFYEEPELEADIGHTYRLFEKTKLFSLENGRGKKILDGRVGAHLPDSVVPYWCGGKNTVCLEWKTFAKIHITSKAMDEVECYRIVWEVYKPTLALEDCFNMIPGHWYGAAEMDQQEWPLERANRTMAPFVSSDLRTEPEGFGSVLDRYFLSSMGVAVIVDDNVPLHVGIGGEKLCLKAWYDRSPFPNPNNAQPMLNYSLCVGSDVKAVHKYVVDNILPRVNTTKSVPDTAQMQSPRWATWPYLKSNMNATTIINYADNIVNNSLTHSVIEIGDSYSTKYGDFDFDPTKFPDPAGMIGQLKQDQFKVSLWVHPFANYDSRTFVEGLREGHWVNSAKGNAPGIVKWWNGYGTVIDVTSKDARSWFISKIRRLQQDYGCDGAYFDGGEVSYLPAGFVTESEPVVPDEYARLYVSKIAADFGPSTQVSVGYRTQDIPMFVRTTERRSAWDNGRGLKSVVPTVLTMGILGYPFVNPGPVGGSSGEQPDRELYVRWLELAVFLPVVEFSWPPWRFGQDMVQFAQKMLKLREDVVITDIIELARDSLETGEPIIRPLWWLAPKDNIAQAVDSEFLIGNATLVAPILAPSATTRDIYLPSGCKWKEGLRNGVVYNGGQMLEDYEVQLYEIAYFTRVDTET